MKSKAADKSKETRKQLSNIANKMTAENEACTKATKEIYQTFMAAFPGGTQSKDGANQASLVEDSQDSDAEEETECTAGESVTFSPVTDFPDTRTSPNARINNTSPTSHIVERKRTVPPSLGEPTVTLPCIQRQMSPSVFLPSRVPVTPSTGSRQKLLSPTQSGSLTARSATTLSETAEALVRAMNRPLNDDEDSFLPQGVQDFLARPLGQDMSQTSRRDLVQLQEENSQLCDEIAMLRAQLNSSTKNQPGKLQMINIIRNFFFS